MLRLSTQCLDTVGYTEFSIQLLHGVVTLQPKELNLHVSIKAHLEIIMIERQPVGSVWCQRMCQRRTFLIEDKSHGLAPTSMPYRCLYCYDDPYGLPYLLPFLHNLPTSCCVTVNQSVG